MIAKIAKVFAAFVMAFAMFASLAVTTESAASAATPSAPAGCKSIDGTKLFMLCPYAQSMKRTVKGEPGCAGVSINRGPYYWPTGVTTTVVRVSSKPVGFQGQYELQVGANVEGGGATLLRPSSDYMVWDARKLRDTMDDSYPASWTAIGHLRKGAGKWHVCASRKLSFSVRHVVNCTGASVAQMSGQPLYQFFVEGQRPLPGLVYRVRIDNGLSVSGDTPDLFYPQHGKAKLHVYHAEVVSPSGAIAIGPNQKDWF